MDWTQAFAIIGSLGAFIFWMFTKLDNDIKAIGTRLDSQTQRIDQLYQMWAEMQKEIKYQNEKHITMWMDTQKEIRELQKERK